MRTFAVMLYPAAEAVSMLLFLAMLFVWAGVLSGAM
jgi:hypothetical protein